MNNQLSTYFEKIILVVFIMRRKFRLNEIYVPE